MNSIPAIILAAGASLRLGTPKQLAMIGAETLLGRAVRMALEAKLSPVYGVLSADFQRELAPDEMMCVVNREAAEGMASSIRAGVRRIELDATLPAGVVILACDQPAVTGQHLRELSGSAYEVVASEYSGRKGVPAYFPVSAFDALLKLSGDAGARSLLQTARSIPLPGGDLDVDTIEDLEKARKLYAL